MSAGVGSYGVADQTMHVIWTDYSYRRQSQIRFLELCIGPAYSMLVPIYHVLQGVMGVTGEAESRLHHSQDQLPSLRHRYIPILPCPSAFSGLPVPASSPQTLDTLAHHPRHHRRTSHQRQRVL